MRNQFDDYFYDNFIEVKELEDKPYVQIIGESNGELTIVNLDKSTVGELINCLQKVYEKL